MVKSEVGAEMAVLLLHHSWSRNTAIRMQRDIWESGKIGRVSLSTIWVSVSVFNSCIIVTLSCVSALHEMLAPNAVIKVAPRPQRRSFSRFMPVYCPCYVPFNAPLQCSYSMLRFKCANSMRQ